MGCDEQTAPLITLHQAVEQGNLKAAHLMSFRGRIVCWTADTSKVKMPSGLV